MQRLGPQCLSLQAWGGPDAGAGAVGPRPPSEVHCDLRVCVLHSPQASSTRQSVTSRRASVTRAWSCASRSRRTGGKEHGNHLNIYRQSPTPNCSIYGPCPPPLPSALWGLTERRVGGSSPGDQPDGAGGGGGGSGAPGLPSSLEPSSETGPRGLRKAGALATWLLQPRPGCGFILHVAGGMCPVGVSPECGRQDLRKTGGL